MQSDKLIGKELRTLLNLISRRFSHSPNEDCADPMTPMHGMILAYILQSSKEGVMQRDLEEVFTIRRSTASRILQLMENNGLIARISVDYDARLKRIVPTDKGRKIHQKTTAQFDDLEKEMIQGISDEDLNVFFKVIDQIKRNIQLKEYPK